MNWYSSLKIKIAQYNLYEYLRNYSYSPKEILASDFLPEGFYFQKDEGGWSVFAPNNTVISADEITKERARRVALSRIVYILNMIKKEKSTVQI